MNGIQDEQEARSVIGPDTVLMLSPHACIESSTADEVVIYDALTQGRVRVSRALSRALERLRSPIRLGELASTSDLGKWTKALGTLIEKGIVVVPGTRDANGHRAALDPVQETLFRCPARYGGGPAADVSIIGVPFDLGNTIAAGARTGPGMIRRVSCAHDYRVPLSTGSPEGWYDRTAGRRVLEGTTFCDWGDIRFSYGESQHDIFQRLESVAGEAAAVATFPVFLGGDHSITYPIVKALADDSLRIIWLDAHSDCARLRSGLCNHHGNVLTRIMQLDAVEEALCIGVRGYVGSSGAPDVGDRVSFISASAVKRCGARSLLPQLSRNHRYYVSLDVDLLDPCYCPGTSSPVPGGLDLDDARELLSVIVSHCQVVGMDVVELNPGRDPQQLTALCACDLLMTALAERRPSDVAHLVLPSHACEGA